MAEVIAAARGGDGKQMPACGKLRAILTDRVLLNATKEHRSLFPRRAPGVYCTIAQAADRYCRRFWGQGVRAVVYGEAPEPATGEPGDDLAPPQSAYTGGRGENLRACPVAVTFKGERSGLAVVVVPPTA